MVKINNSQGGDDGVIDLRSSHKKHEKEEQTMDEDAEFQISPIEDDMQVVGHQVKVSPIREADISELRTTENVKVKFDKFVSLVAAHATKEFVEQCRDEDVIVSTNLLTDLANSGGESDSKKIPVIFLIGIILGIGLTYMLLKM